MNLIKNLFVLLMVTLLAVACSTSKKAAEAANPAGPAGIWATTVVGTPMGDVDAEMVLMEEGDALKGYVVSNGERMELRNVKVEGEKVSASFFSQAVGSDIFMDVTYKSDTDTLEGWVMDSYRIKGERKAQDGKGM